MALTAAAGCSADPAGHADAHRQAVTGPHAAPSAVTDPRGFTLVASGDVLPHDSVIARAGTDAGGSGYDFRPMLSGVRHVVSPAGLAICHMETVYGPPEGPFKGYPDFVSPPQVAPALAATGYDSCSTASNHTLDAGTEGVRRTLDALDGAGVRHAGSARTAAESNRPAWLKAGGARVAHLAYTYGTNGYPMPEGAPWAVKLIDRDKVVADARAARKAGADIVVVSMHWGTEWEEAPDADQERLGRELTASRTGTRPDIDLILGTHAHVPQAYEKVNGTWIIYGMGDQVAGEMFNYTGARDPRGNESTLGRFTFAPPASPGARWQVRKAEFVPQWYDTDAGRVVDVNAAIDKGADLAGVRDRVRATVLSRGAAADGLTMAE
ncbi:hypothetical protein B1H18_28610 [Streptomyces tsukubensis]|uniref:Capsule synthesis protein CapA domain-containing protein n=1 Tax=Streptomyces tsukubensis TaxID=83656 RepID=A0A1V4A1Q9_9ACTN|nr:hypothetical protein B1H18_28610 [Streptomyces tsukubensis]